MIANRPIQHSISIIHFIIGIFCVSVFTLYVATEAKWSFSSLIRAKESFFVLLLGVISLSSLFGALSWQTVSSKISKTISYLLSLFFLIEYIAILFISNKTVEYVLALIPTITPAIFLFLVAFSKVSEFQENKIENNDYLDSDFLSDTKASEKTIILSFWQPNRIVSFTSFVFALLVFLALMSSGAPIWTIFIPSIVLVVSIILWLLPKLGSWIFSILSSLLGVGLVSLFVFMMITKPFNATKDKIYLIGFICLLVLSSASFGWTLAMFLLSKEAKEEWKSRH